MADVESLIAELFDVEAIRFGEFKLKSGLFSPVYFNLRVIIGYPKLLRTISELLYETVKRHSVSNFSLICGVPYTALPIATCMSLDHNIPMVIRRREVKDYGTKQMIEGVFSPGDVCVVVEDVVTTGGSVLETMNELVNAKLVVKDAVVLLDRSQGGNGRLNKHGINLHSVFTISQVLDVLLKRGSINQELFTSVQSFLKDNQFKPSNDLKLQRQRKMSYLERSDLVQNKVAKKLFHIMHAKQTNLCFSVDVCSTKELLDLADSMGPYICILKTHVDILTDFSKDFIKSLMNLAEKHNFIIFEDRKFADIGNTVKNQYSKGIYNISSWAELTNAHGVPGEGIVHGLKEAASKFDRACLLIAQMSSSGALTNESYTKSVVNMANSNDDFVIGFISTSAMSDNPKFIYMTPGVSLNSSNDHLGQQYLSPEEVIKNRGCDVIIVGRGIYGSSNPVESAKKYQRAGYQAYLEGLES